MISPLTLQDNSTIEKEIPVKEIINLYKKQYQTDVSQYFKDLQHIAVYRCNQTGFRFFYPFVEGDNLFYEELQKKTGYYFPLRWEHDAIMQYIQKENSILEIGCGNGDFIQRLASQSIDAVGLELNRDAFGIAKGNGLKVYNETLEEHASKNIEKYDIICSFQVLEHVSNPNQFISLSLQTLKKNGLMIISVPNNNSFIGLDNTNSFNLPPHHLGLWDEKSLSVLESIFPVKLKNIHIEPLNNLQYNYFFWILQKQIQQKFGLIASLLFRCTRFLYKPLFQKSEYFFKGSTVIAVYTKI